MSWFGEPTWARAEFVPPTRLSLRRAEAADVEVDLALCREIGFVRVGEAFAFVDEGWWLLSTPEGAVALNVQCPMVDVLLRDDELRAIADGIADKYLLELASRPRQFRGRGSTDGVAILTIADVDALRRQGGQTAVASISDFPRVL